jgi:segregation and condensation protein B
MEQEDVAPAAPLADEPLETGDQIEPGEEVLSEQLFIVEGANSAETISAKLKAVVEAAIYVTEEPLSLAQIAAAIEQPVDTVKRVLGELAREYAQEDRGLTIREVAGGFKMATKPEHHEAIRTFVKNLKPPLKLSAPALETLAAIAYKQPLTAPEIMEIRGVQGAGVLKTLLDRKLIAAAGRKQVIGKPILYKTTKEFLIQFGLKDLSELPTLKEFEDLGRMAMADTEEAETAAEDRGDPPDSPPVEEPEPEPSPIEEPDHPRDPGPAEDPQEQPVKAQA